MLVQKAEHKGCALKTNSIFKPEYTLNELKINWHNLSTSFSSLLSPPEFPEQ